MNFLTTMKSVVAAFFGVQSDDNRKRDFSQGKFLHFAIAGIITVIFFVLSLVLIVNWVLTG